MGSPLVLCTHGPRQIAHLIKEKFGAAVTESLPDDKHPRVHVNGEDWREIAEFVRRDQR